MEELRKRGHGGRSNLGMPNGGRISGPNFNGLIDSGTVSSLPNSPARVLSKRKSIFSSEPKYSRSQSSSRVMGSNEDIRLTKRQGSQRNLALSRTVSQGVTNKKETASKPVSKELPRQNSKREIKSADPRGGLSRSVNMVRCEYEELPKLPIPPLADTLAQYLDNVRPVVSDEMFTKTKMLVDKFGSAGGVGEKVHQMLVDKRDKEDNWAYNMWLEDMYLNCRLPLPVNSNPGMVLPRMNFNSPSQMISFASRIVNGFIKLKKQLDSHSLPQDTAATRETGQPLCMEQYYRLMTTYRQPRKIQDKPISTGVDAKSEENILVGRKGHWYSVSVKSGGKWCSIEEIFSTLMDVLDHADRSEYVPDRERVSYFTGMNRDSWGEAYSELSINKINSENLDLVTSSLLVVCLDVDHQNLTDKERSMKDCFRQMLTGSGSRYNSSNRWFDQTIQLILTMDGVCGLCYEHSPSEGIAVVQLLEGIIRDMDGKCTDLIGYHPVSGSKFKRLEWDLDEEMKEKIDEARIELDKLDSDNDLEVFSFSEYGKSFIKSCRCSPDAWIQMSLQLTMFKLTGNIVPTYESASTRRFRLGRVDSIRASHQEAKEWCRVMTNNNNNKEERRKLFEKAMKKQTTVMIDNILGRGLDIPLLGLREITREGTMVGLWEKQDIFLDPSYSKINTFTLSTSQVPVGMCQSFMGYGAVVPWGYGVSYNPYPDSVIFCISSCYSFPTSNSRRFAATLQESLMDLKQMFIK